MPVNRASKHSYQDLDGMWCICFHTQDQNWWDPAEERGGAEIHKPSCAETAGRFNGRQPGEIRRRPPCQITYYYRPFVAGIVGRSIGWPLREYDDKHLQTPESAVGAWGRNSGSGTYLQRLMDHRHSTASITVILKMHWIFPADGRLVCVWFQNVVELKEQLQSKQKEHEMAIHSLRDQVVIFPFLCSLCFLLCVYSVWK